MEGKPKRAEYPAGMAGRAPYNGAVQTWRAAWVMAVPVDKNGSPVRPDRKDFSTVREFFAARAAYNWARHHHKRGTHES